MSDFPVNITKLLKLSNVTEWSGKTLKEREEKIREAALILAGQCVAILLDKLSKSREAKETAINQTPREKLDKLGQSWKKVAFFQYKYIELIDKKATFFLPTV